MGDKLVEDVLAELRSLAFANGVEPETLRPFADMWVNMLRNSGMEEEEIRRRLVVTKEFEIERW
jgi:hypothetical protein